MNATLLEQLVAEEYADTFARCFSQRSQPQMPAIQVYTFNRT